MRIKKLNEWKCDISIDDVDAYVEPTGILKNMVEHFKLKYNSSTESYDCDGDVDLYYYYYYGLSAIKQREFDKAFVNDGKMTIRFGEVKGNFILLGKEDNGYILTSLIGCPQTVGGNFDCSYNQIISLKGCPKSVGGYFSCRNNQLTSLKGCPKKIGGAFICNNNQLTSLAGCPESVDGGFACYDNKMKFTEKDVKTVCDVKRGIYV